jgi:hypothetical protein
MIGLAICVQLIVQLSQIIPLTIVLPVKIGKGLVGNGVLNAYLITTAVSVSRASTYYKLKMDIIVSIHVINRILRIKICVYHVIEDA